MLNFCTSTCRAFEICVFDHCLHAPCVLHKFPTHCQMCIIRCRVGVLQYVALQLVCTALSVMFEAAGVYNEGSMSFSDAYIYVASVSHFFGPYLIYLVPDSTVFRVTSPD